MIETYSPASRIALGTVQFGLPYGIANQSGKIAQDSVKAMLKLAFENGIEMLDTAIAYGESEACLGRVGTQNFKLITKLPAVPDDGTDVNGWVQRQFSDSLVRLGVNKVYGLLLHRPEQLLEPIGASIFQALQNLKDTQQVAKIGVSIYVPDELDQLSRRYCFDLVQAPFNLIDRRLHKSGWLQRLKNEGVEIHTRSVFLQGLLLMHQTAIPSKFLPWTGLLNNWHEWLMHHKVSAVRACLAFPLAFPEIDHVIVGADSVNQLQEIISAAIDDAPSGFPDLQCDEEDLINPAHWPQL